MSQKDQAKLQNNFRISLAGFKNLGNIDEGGFGSVFKVIDQKTNLKYAAKVICCNGDKKQYKKSINREVSILMRFQHPTIIKFYGYSLTDFEGKENVTILMELSEKGSLAKLLENNKKGLSDLKYDNTYRQIILIGIAQGMRYLHQNHIIHRDLKPGNILLNDDYYPLIIDFGLSKIPITNSNTSTLKGCGTPIYMAPESISLNHYNEKTDVYSYGILMYEVVTDMDPYPSLKNGEMTDYLFKKLVIEDSYRPIFKPEWKIKESIQDLIKNCWSHDPNKRPTFEEIFRLLAYNRVNPVINIFEGDGEEEECEGKYYLEDVNKDDVMCYVDSIYEVSTLSQLGQLDRSSGELNSSWQQLASTDSKKEESDDKTHNKKKKDKKKKSSNDDKKINDMKSSNDDKKINDMKSLNDMKSSDENDEAGDHSDLYDVIDMNDGDKMSSNGKKSKKVKSKKNAVEAENHDKEDKKKKKSSDGILNAGKKAKKKKKASDEVGCVDVKDKEINAKSHLDKEAETVNKGSPDDEIVARIPEESGTPEKKAKKKKKKADDEVGSVDVKDNGSPGDEIGMKTPEESGAPEKKAKKKKKKADDEVGSVDVKDNEINSKGDLDKEAEAVDNGSPGDEIGMKTAEESGTPKKKAKKKKKKADDEVGSVDVKDNGINSKGDLDKEAEAVDNGSPGDEIGMKTAEESGTPDKKAKKKKKASDAVKPAKKAKGNKKLSDEAVDANKSTEKVESKSPSKKDRKKKEKKNSIEEEKVPDLHESCRSIESEAMLNEAAIREFASGGAVVAENEKEEKVETKDRLCDETRSAKNEEVAVSAADEPDIADKKKKAKKGTKNADKKDKSHAKEKKGKKKAKAEKIIETEERQVEELNPVTEIIKEEELNPVTEIIKEEELNPVTEIIKEEELNPVTEIIKEEELNPVTEIIKEEELNPVTEIIKEEELNPVTEIIKEEEASPASDVKQVKEEETNAEAIEINKEEEKKESIPVTEASETKERAIPVSESGSVAEANRAQDGGSSAIAEFAEVLNFISDDSLGSHSSTYSTNFSGYTSYGPLSDLTPSDGETRQGRQGPVFTSSEVKPKLSYSVRGILHNIFGLTGNFEGQFGIYATLQLYGKSSIFKGKGETLRTPTVLNDSCPEYNYEFSFDKIKKGDSIQINIIRNNIDGVDDLIIGTTSVLIKDNEGEKELPLKCPGNSFDNFGKMNLTLHMERSENYIVNDV